ncbi:MAG: hypothetical protein C4532_09995 [Candidatus Abyssobacteria bacterium SURF_17]|uniref:DUF1579 domain-containing protein n=1 Tax=Candidatus Abyssobacteria bacterium SURF_17 TaxID=2093361 RepID=A0A419EY90_9BACT|nr:MAG: hypothetical protein C4532_09995 [Candidatus Abyssubacteria bacterium SURF_17]
MEKRTVASTFAQFFMAVLLGLAIVTSTAFAKSEMKPDVRVVPQFEKMKSLAGEWQGKSNDGVPATVTYELVSNDSALMERLSIGAESEMVTMYHPDGDRLMMTHYCSVRNQPRMRAQPAATESNKIVLDFVDVTNLSAPDAGHMKKLVVTFEDADHFTQEWTWREKEQEGATVFHFERKK